MKTPYRLYLVISSEDNPDLSLEETVNAAIQSGVDCIQLREKNLTIPAFIDKARALKNIVSRYNTPLFINDSLEVAREVSANGLHLGQSDMPFATARALLPKAIQIGMTIDHLSEIERLNHYSLAYLGVSSLFKSQTKLDQKNIWSQSDIKVLKEKSKHPLIGIGGITKENVNHALSLNLDGLALSAAICQQKSIKEVSDTTAFFKTLLRNTSNE